MKHRTKGLFLAVLFILTSVVPGSSSFILTTPCFHLANRRRRCIQHGTVFKRRSQSLLKTDKYEVNNVLLEGYDGNIQTSTNWTRRGALKFAALRSVFLVSPLVGPGSSFPSFAATAENQIGKKDAINNPFGISDAVLSSLVFERILGQVSYKTVFLVVSGITDDEQQRQPIRFALAVERLKSKSDVKDAIRGIRVAEELENRMNNDEDRRLCEQVQGWWFQDDRLPNFEEQMYVFPPHLLLANSQQQRTKKPPSRFLGTKWLIALKPVYDMDLKRFAQASPVLNPIIEDSNIASTTVTRHTTTTTTTTTESIIAGIPLTEESAINLVRDLCYAGRIMHSAGLVHRDIKPKNIMLNNGRPVIIDFGFSHFVNKDKRDGRYCIVQEGRVKGEARYVLAPDVALSKGCQEGDVYAMGKTLYELLFDDAPGALPSGKVAITEAEAAHENALFREKLNRNDAGTRSRFQMTSMVRDFLLYVIRGLCREEDPISFKQAEEILLRVPS